MSFISFFKFQCICPFGRISFNFFISFKLSAHNRCICKCDSATFRETDERIDGLWPLLFQITGYLSVPGHISHFFWSFLIQIDRHMKVHMGNWLCEFELHWQISSRIMALYFSKLQSISLFRAISVNDFRALKPHLTKHFRVFFYYK